MEREEHRDDGRSDRGQALGLVLMSVALIAMIAAGIASAATRLTERSRAQNAADAAALAGVSGGAVEASILAARNGAVLVSFDDVTTEQGVIVSVEVMVGDEWAIARASSVP